MKEHLDKYFTNPNIAIECFNYLKKNIKIDMNRDCIVEPSAGTGSFIVPINKLCKNSVFVDIYPENTAIIKLDYFKMFPNTKDFRKIHVVGNPPFGFKASMAIQFIKHSCTFCDTFAFILPKSFEKYSMKNTVPKNFHMVFSYILLDDSFHSKDTLYNIPCVFQIWVKRTYERTKLKKIIPTNYTFLPSCKNADVAIRRVGYYAGNVFVSALHSKNMNTHYFIKLNNKKDISKISNINISSTYNVSGPKSISKRDIIKHLNKIL